MPTCLPCHAGSRFSIIEESPSSFGRISLRYGWVGRLECSDFSWFPELTSTATTHLCCQLATALDYHDAVHYLTMKESMQP